MNQTSALKNFVWGSNPTVMQLTTPKVKKKGILQLIASHSLYRAAVIYCIGSITVSTACITVSSTSVLIRRTIASASIRHHLHSVETTGVYSIGRPSNQSLP